MLKRAGLLRKAIDLFMSVANNLFGLITVIRQNGHVVKKIPWTAFKLDDTDWARIADAQAILAVSFLSIISALA